MKYSTKSATISRGFSSLHNGIDNGYSEAKDKNQPIYSCNDAVVIYNRYKKIGGYIIKTEDDRYIITYGHLQKDSQKVKEGDKVKKGQQIANMGNSGINCIGNHLHLSVYDKKLKKYIDPLTVLNIYKDQTVGKTTDKKYKLYRTKIANGIPSEPLLVHNEPNYKKTSVIKNMGIYNGDEVETYGTKNGMNIIDSKRGYYCSNKYLKDRT